MGRITHASGLSASRSGAALAIAAVFSICSATAANAHPSIEQARHRAAALEISVGEARAEVAALQHQILALASRVQRAQRSLNHVETRLLVAQQGLAEAQLAFEAIQARMDEQARQAFMTLGPGSSAAYLLGADSFGDLMDRTMMLGRVQQADAALAADVKSRADGLSAASARFARATRERGRIYGRVAARQAQLLAAFTAQQDALAVLVGEHRSAVRSVGQLQRRMAREAGALPFGDWADRFLAQIGSPTCRDNRVVVVAWQANEFTQARWNPLATTHDMPGATSFNSVGVRNYRSLTQGLRASEQTLTGGASSFGYGAILDDLRACAPAAVTADAIRASAWCRGCSNGGYVAELIPIVEQYFDRYAAFHA